MTLPSQFLLPLSPSPVLLLLLKPLAGFWNTGEAPNATTISETSLLKVMVLVGATPFGAQWGGTVPVWHPWGVSISVKHHP